MSARASVELDGVTVRQHFKGDPGPHELAILRFEVLAALHKMDAEIDAGVRVVPRWVRGVPLMEWLDLAEIADLAARLAPKPLRPPAEAYRRDQVAQELVGGGVVDVPRHVVPKRKASRR